MPDNPDQQPGNTPPDSGLSKSEKTELRNVMAEGSEKIEQDEGQRREELRLNMLRSVVTEPLLSKVRANPDDTYDVIISLNELYWEGMDKANEQVRKLAEEWKSNYAHLSNYVFACLAGARILELARITQEQIQNAAKSGRPKDARTAATIYRIWEDNDVHMSLTKSLATVKADAAQRAFQASGRGITWAVLDSGIQGDHPHFKRSESPFGAIDSLNVESPLKHSDFTPQGRNAAATDPATALTDRLGHGTHVAGIIAGYWAAENPAGEPVVGVEERNDFTPQADGDEDQTTTVHSRDTLRSISGVAPACRLLSLKVIADVTDKNEGSRQTAKQGKVSWILQAIDQIQTWNQNGRRLLVHGVNMSVGYDFDPRWFACGESPLCVEVNRLVKTGVAVVVSAGNGGYTAFLTRSTQALERYSDLSITDPGNAELAVTVGSTHREMPHRYGVSYFSSRGPTGDGRLKPDLLAPGERIVSCAAGQERAKFGDIAQADDLPLYVEQTGTSMAAPHVSGAIAAFLSVRTEFIGQPERVKETFMNSAMDLKRERTFQGAGLVDLMKALQSV